MTTTYATSSTAVLCAAARAAWDALDAAILAGLAPSVAHKHFDAARNAASKFGLDENAGYRAASTVFAAAFENA